MVNSAQSQDWAFTIDITCQLLYNILVIKYKRRHRSQKHKEEGVMRKQRLLTLAIVICLLACLFTACDTNVDADNKDDDPVEYSVGLAYSVNTGGGTCTITGTGTCIDSEISIPKEIDGYTVTAIAPYAFYNNSGIITVLIPEGVTSIGDKAFYNCSSLTSITIPDSVITIGEEAFSGCLNIVETTISIFAVKHIPKDNLKTLVITNGTTIGASAFSNCTRLTRVTIPDSVTSIGQYAFYGCSSLTRMTIPDSVTTIGQYAFYGCSSLTRIVIPDSVTSIGECAFYDCSSFTSVTIGDSVTTIGECAFAGCDSLTSIIVDENNTKYKSIDGNIYTKDGTTLIQYACGKSGITIPKSVTTIGQYAFSGCDSLTSIIIPDSVTSIGIGAFGGCESLTSITLPFVGATKDGEGRGHFGYIFGADTNDYNSICVPDSLKEVVITGGTIGSYAFYECRSLISVTIGNSVTYIGVWAFDDCRNLTNVIFNDPNGWYVIDSHDVAEERTRVTLTNKTKNATYLRSTYGRYYWYKS